MKISISIYTLFCPLFCISISNAQVGIGNSNPQSTLDIAASNKATPTSTDGIIIPKFNVFPTTNPTAAQDGMLAFLTEAKDSYKKGLHFWDNSASTWVAYGGQWIDGYNKDFESLSYANQASANGVDVVILDNGRIGMGTDTPEESLELKFEGDNDIQISTNGSKPNAPNIIYFTKGGTFSSPDFLNNNDPIGSLTAKGYTGSAKSDDIAYVNMVADGNHVSGSLATKFDFSVTESGDDNAAASGVQMTIRENGNVGIGTVNPTATLQIKAGTSAANSAPLKFNYGPILTTPETGAIEFGGSRLYITTSASRREILKGLSNTAPLDYPILLSGITNEMTVSVPGAEVGDTCNCTPLGAIENDLKWGCYVSAANVVTLRLSNISANLIDPANNNWRVTVID